MLQGGKHIDLSTVDVSSIQKIGGTILRSSRTNLFAIENGVAQVKQTIANNNIDVIIAIGGDDTLGACERLVREHNIQAIGIPKTIDNDLYGTYWSPGYPSAASHVAHIAEHIRRDAAYALRRAFVIETYGMKSGWLTAAAGLGKADVILTPEREVNTEHVLNTIYERYEANGSYAVIAVAENTQFSDSVEGEEYDAADTFGHKRQNHISIALRRIIKKQLNIDSRVIMPGNIVQSGEPTPIDGETATALGRQAIAMIENEDYGHIPSIEVDQKNLAVTIGKRPLSEVVSHEGPRKIDDEMFDFANYQVKPAFLEYLKPMQIHPHTPEEYIALQEKIRAIE